LNRYETVFVIDSLLKPDEIQNIISKYERFISANGGHIETVDQWGKKRLAYEIKKRQYGFYVLIRFSGPPPMLKQLEREYRLNESILRYKILIMTRAAIKALEKQAAENKKLKAEAEAKAKAAREEKEAREAEKAAAEDEDKETTEPTASPAETESEPSESEPKAEEETSEDKSETAEPESEETEKAPTEDKDSDEETEKKE
jgi:small subunit ribosomal protein S6